MLGCTDHFLINPRAVFAALSYRRRERMFMDIAGCFFITQDSKKFWSQPNYFKHFFRLLSQMWVPSAHGKLLFTQLRDAENNFNH